jgi:hypothetical protein
MFANVRDEAAARELAEENLRASPHHIQIEAREADVLMFTLQRSEIMFGFAGVE